MKHIYTYLLGMISVILLLSSCKKESGPSYGPIQEFDFSGATMLYVTHDVSIYNNYSNAQLYKVMRDGSVVHLPFIDQNGHEVPVSSCSINEVSNDLTYIALFNNSDIKNPYDTGYLVKDNGSFHFISPTFSTVINFSETANVDRYDNLYISGYGNASIYKMSPDISNGIKYEKLTADYEATSYFADYDGNLFFNISYNKSVYRPNNTGEFILMDYINLFSLKGQVGFFRFREYRGLYKLTFDPATKSFKETEIAKIENDIGRTPNNLIYYKDKIILIENNLIIKKNSIEKFNSPEGSLKSYITYNAAYWQTNSQITVFDFDTEKTKTIFDDSNYQISDYIVNLDGSIVLAAQNLRTGRNITGTIKNGFFEESLDLLPISTRITKYRVF